LKSSAVTKPPDRYRGEPHQQRCFTSTKDDIVQSWRPASPTWKSKGISATNLLCQFHRIPSGAFRSFSCDALRQQTFNDAALSRLDLTLTAMPDARSTMGPSRRNNFQPRTRSGFC
jgi:hypothetical protein